MAAETPSMLSPSAQRLTQASTFSNFLGAGLSDGARRAIALWLGGCAAWVFSMVVLGGMTRLTRSGLSMTEWKFTGEKAPSTQEDWEAEFSKYKASPEYHKVNRGMSLEEFKFIYWMEYAHRMWGRALAVVFAVPAVYFAARGWVNGPLARRLGLLFAMGATQGFVGWWMVRSGLQETKEEWEVPRVSPYRLAAHLTSAAIIYGTLLWTSLSLAFPTSAAAAVTSDVAMTAGVNVLRRWAHPVAGIIALTALSGAFVAGMDAGHAYNTFPLMNGRLIPEEYWALPGWRNAFESTAAVQLHHRALALCTLGAVTALWARARTLPLPGPSRLLVHAMMGMVALQVALGITTLLTYVPPSLGTAHQAGALTLLTLALGLLHTLRRGPSAAAKLGMASQLGTPAALAAVLAVGTAVTQFS
ncbi:g2452 [Coccomyxa elongata]